MARLSGMWMGCVIRLVHVWVWVVWVVYQYVMVRHGTSW